MWNNYKHRAVKRGKQGNCVCVTGQNKLSKKKKSKLSA